MCFGRFSERWNTDERAYFGVATERQFRSTQSLKNLPRFLIRMRLQAPAPELLANSQLLVALK